MGFLDPEELKRLFPAESHSYAAPIPTQSVSSDEFTPSAQTPAPAAGRGPRPGARQRAGRPPGRSTG